MAAQLHRLRTPRRADWHRAHPLHVLRYRQQRPGHRPRPVELVPGHGVRRPRRDLHDSGRVQAPRPGVARVPGCGQPPDDDRPVRLANPCDGIVLLLERRIRERELQHRSGPVSALSPQAAARARRSLPATRTSTADQLRRARRLVPSGEGVRPYFPDTDVRDEDECHRSTRAYPQLFRFGSGAPRLSSFACSGATSADISTDTQEGEGSPQADHPELSAPTDLVTITIGGNDAGFSAVLRGCALRHFVGRDCTRGAVRRLLREGLAALPAKLDVAFDSIRTRLGPHSAAIVLDYPQLFPAALRRQRCPRLATLYTPRVQRFLRDAAVDLRDVLRAAAARAGFQFLDVMPAFAGHEVCTRHPWIRPLKLSLRQLRRFKLPFDYGSFHPNAAGQAAYARALESYIHHRIRRHSPLTPAGLPANP